jgi:hypothetical protein
MFWFSIREKTSTPSVNGTGFRMERVFPLHQVVWLSQNWYGTHGDPNWHKWTTSESQALFKRPGFISAFWDLDQKEDLH